MFESEPLPPDSKLWELDNVFLSPHCADRTKEFQHQSLGLFLKNMTRYISGQDLLNVCDKKGGY